MNLLIPVDSKNKEEALLTKLDDIKNWAFIEIVSRLESQGI